MRHLSDDDFIPSARGGKSSLFSTLMTHSESQRVYSLEQLLRKKEYQISQKPLPSHLNFTRYLQFQDNSLHLVLLNETQLVWYSLNFSNIVQTITLNSTVSEILTDLDHGQIALIGQNASIIQVVKGKEVIDKMENYLNVAREMIWIN